MHRNRSNGSGGGLWITRQSRVLNSTVSNNESAVGGGVYVDFPTGVKIINCSISGNEATDDDSGGGGGIFIDHNTTGAADIVNCLIVNNTSGYLGGGVESGAGTFHMVNCTVVNNQTEYLGGGVDAGGGTNSHIYNSIFRGNSVGQIGSDPQISANFPVHYSNIEDGWSGSGSNNIDADPNFESPSTGNFRLQCPSPSVNAGVNSAVPCDEFTVDEDGQNCQSSPPQPTPDRDLSTRIVHLADQGAYELPVSNPDCLGDANGDCVVNVNDLLAVINNWGACPSPPASCPADVAPIPCGNGVVNVNDLLMVINTWGDFCSCYVGEWYEVGSLQSVQDCMDACSEVYQTYSEDWEICVNETVAKMCEAGALPPEDCP